MGLKAGGPDNLTVNGNNSLTLEDVLVGEVWVGSGQSDMAGGVNGYTKGDPVLASLAAAAPYPRLRLLKVASNGWQEATEANVNGFSALLFGFGAPLQKELDVPVGLIFGTGAARLQAAGSVRKSPGRRAVPAAHADIRGLV